MYTATLPLSRAWLTDPLNLSVSVQCGTRQSQDAQYALSGDFREYAGDRIQLVDTFQHTLTRVITLVALTPAQRQQIIAWQGTLLCLRLADGSRFFGGFLAISEHILYNVSMDGGLTASAYNMTITFSQATYVEAV